MPKVMLVEDDNNLREIYEARLAAEGYEIVSAHDGEEALAIAVKEKPDLIISDIMMPKISGFDMLDILRSTPETRDAKIVMMTALSQAEDKERAGKLGADKYLVKSQVTLEDVVRVAKELLDGATMVDPAQPTAPATDSPASTIPVATAPADGPTVDTSVPPAPDAPDTTTTAAVTPTEPAASTPPAPDPVTTSTDPVTTAPAPVATDDNTNATPQASDTAPVSADPVANDSASTSDTTTASSIPVADDTTSSPAPAPTQDQPDTGSTEDPEPAQAATAPGSVEDQIKDFISTAEQVKNNANTPVPPPQTPPAASAPTQIPVTSADDAPAADTTPAEPQLATPSGQKKVIEPLNDLSQGGPDLDALLAKEESKPADTTTPVPSVNTVISPDGTLSYASAPPSDAAPTTAEPTVANPPASANDTQGEEPHQPGQKIDPDSVAL